MEEGSFARVDTNVVALNALNALKGVQRQLGISHLRSATGRRINESAGDPAGLTIATKLEYRASGLGQALENLGDAKSLLAVAEGGLAKIKDTLVRMRDKAEQAASDTSGANERHAIQKQLNHWTSEIDDIVGSTKWNGKKLLDGLGDFSANTVNLQVGVETDSADRLTLVGGNGPGAFGAVDATSLGIASNGVSIPPAPASAALLSDPDDLIVNDVLNTPGPGNRSDIPQLATGQYTLQVHWKNAQQSYTIQLLDSGGTPVTIDPDGDPVNTPADAPNTKITGGQLGQRSIDLGTNLSLDVRVRNLNGARQAVIDYTAASSGSSGGNSLDVSTGGGAQAAMEDLGMAIDLVSSRLETVGSLVSRLSFLEERVTLAKANTEAAYSRIRNADMAFEAMEVAKHQILQWTSTVMLAQANLTPWNVLEAVSLPRVGERARRIGSGR